MIMRRSICAEGAHDVEATLRAEPTEDHHDVVGAAAHLSMRRGYWFFPELLFGQPIMQILSRAGRVPEGVTPLAELTPEEAMKFALEGVGDQRCDN